MTVKMKEDDVCEGLVKGRADTALKILPVSVLGAWTPVLVLPHFYLRHGRVPLDLLGAYESTALWVSSSPWETRVQGQEEGKCRHRGAC